MKPWKDDGPSSPFFVEGGSDDGEEPPSPTVIVHHASATPPPPLPMRPCVVDLANHQLTTLHELDRRIATVRRAVALRAASSGRGRHGNALSAAEQATLASSALASIARGQFLRDHRRWKDAAAEAAELEELEGVEVELNAELAESVAIERWGLDRDGVRPSDPIAVELRKRIDVIRSQKKIVSARREALLEEYDADADFDEREENNHIESEEERGWVGGRTTDVAILFLHGNALRTLAGVGVFSNLRKLDVAQNSLRTLPGREWWAQLPQLEVLYLHGNQLESVAHDVAPLAALPSLVSLTLAANPLAAGVNAAAYRSEVLALIVGGGGCPNFSSLDARLVTEDERLAATYGGSGGAMGRSVTFQGELAVARCSLSKSPWHGFAVTTRLRDADVARAMGPQYRPNALHSDHFDAFYAEVDHAMKVWHIDASPAMNLQIWMRQRLVHARWRRRIRACALVQTHARAWLHRFRSQRELRDILEAANMSDLLLHPTDTAVRKAVLTLQNAYRASVHAKMSTRVALVIQRIVRWWRWTTTMQAAAVKSSHGATSATTKEEELAICCHADDEQAVRAVMLRSRHAASRWIARASALDVKDDEMKAVPDASDDPGNSFFLTRPSSASPARSAAAVVFAGTPYRPLSARRQRDFGKGRSLGNVNTSAGARSGRTDAAASSSSYSPQSHVAARKPMEARLVPFVALRRDGHAGNTQSRGVFLLRHRRRRNRIGAAVTPESLARARLVLSNDEDVAVSTTAGGVGLKRRGVAPTPFERDLLRHVVRQSRSEGTPHGQMLLAIALPCPTTVAIACRRLRHIGIPVILLRDAKRIASAVAVQSMWRAHSSRRRVTPSLYTRVRQTRAATLIARLWRSRPLRQRFQFIAAMWALARSLKGRADDFDWSTVTSSDGADAIKAKRKSVMSSGATLYLEERVLALIVADGPGVLAKHAPGVALGSGGVVLVARTRKEWLRRLPRALASAHGIHINPPRTLAHFDFGESARPMLRGHGGTLRSELPRAGETAGVVYDEVRGTFRNKNEAAMVARSRRRTLERQRPLLRASMSRGSSRAASGPATGTAVETASLSRRELLLQHSTSLAPLSRKASMETAPDVEAALRLLTVGVVAHATEVKWVEIGMPDVTDFEDDNNGERDTTTTSRVPRTVKLLKLTFASKKEARRRALALAALTWTPARRSGAFDLLGRHEALWAPLFTRQMLNDGVQWSVRESHRQWSGRGSMRRSASRSRKRAPTSVAPLVSLPSAWAVHRTRCGHEGASASAVVETLAKAAASAATQLPSYAGASARILTQRAAKLHAKGIVARWRSQSTIASLRAKQSHDQKVRELETRLKRNAVALRQSQLKMRARWWRSLWEESEAANEAERALQRQARQVEKKRAALRASLLPSDRTKKVASSTDALGAQRWKRPQLVQAKPKIEKLSASAAGGSAADARRRRRRAKKVKALGRVGGGGGAATARAARRAATRKAGSRGSGGGEERGGVEGGRVARPGSSKQRLCARIVSAQRYGGETGY